MNTSLTGCCILQRWTSSQKLCTCFSAGLQNGKVAAKSNEKMATAYFLKWFRLKCWHQVERLSSLEGENEGEERSTGRAKGKENAGSGRELNVYGQCCDVSVFS